MLSATQTASTSALSIRGSHKPAIVEHSHTARQRLHRRPGPVAAQLAQTLSWQAPQLPRPRPRKLLTWQPPQSPERITTSQVPEDARSGPDHRPGSGSRVAELLPDRPESEVVASGSLLDRVFVELANLGRHDEAVLRSVSSLCGSRAPVPRLSPDGRDPSVGGKSGRRARCASEVLYLDPGHDEALLALAQRGAAGRRRRGHGFSAAAERAILKKEVPVR